MKDLVQKLKELQAEHLVVRIGFLNAGEYVGRITDVGSNYVEIEFSPELDKPRQTRMTVSLNFFLYCMASRGELTSSSEDCEDLFRPKKHKLKQSTVDQLETAGAATPLDYD